MKRWIILIALLIIPVLYGHSQGRKQTLEFINGDINRAGISNHYYEPNDTIPSAAPKGYTAFYISHYGRHGSRYEESRKYFDAVDELGEYSQSGLLTGTGMALYSELKCIVDSSENHWGELSMRGAREQVQIAQRMARHYPGVFSGKNTVDVYSSKKGRVIASRNNFLSGLGAIYPELDINVIDPKELNSKERIFGTELSQEMKDEIASFIKSKEYRVGAESYKDSSKFNTKRIVSVLFKSIPENLDSKKQYRLTTHLFTCGIWGGCLDMEMPVFKKVFSAEDGLFMWIRDNNKWYLKYCKTSSVPDYRVQYVGKTILRYMIEDADKAIDNGNIAATLRFGHDGCLLPLIGTIEPESCCFHGNHNESWQYVNLSRIVCMASNIQFIFYHNNQGDVIVKLLQNEKETLINGIAPYSGVYYKWSDLRPILLERIR